MAGEEAELAELPTLQGEEKAARVAGKFQEAVAFGLHGVEELEERQRGGGDDAHNDGAVQAARANASRPPDGNSITVAMRSVWRGQAV